MLVPRQAGSFPRSGRRAGSASAQSQAGSVNTQGGSVSIQLERSAGNAGTQSQESSVSSQAGSISSPSREGVQAGQALLPTHTGFLVPAKALLALQWGMPLLPGTKQLVSMGNNGRHL